MNIINIELMSIEETKLGFEHWVEVAYSIDLVYFVKYLFGAIWGILSSYNSIFT